MNLLGIIAHHGYAVTAAVLFLAAAGIPVPTSVVLVGAGAASAHGGPLHLWIVLPLTWLAAVTGDSLLYYGGKTTGWWLLSGLCRMSPNPEHCIFRSAEYFYRRGPKTLLFAKFVPGLASMAAPLAGSLNMRFLRFLRMDALGALFYVASWMLAGYIFSPFIDKIVHGIEAFGHAVTLAVIALVVLYAAMYLIARIRARKYRRIERISATTLHERLQTADPNRLVIIADVRSHGYYDPGGHRIKNSIRVEPARLKEELVALREFMAPECEIYLYCSCIKDTTSVRIAHMLEQENCKTSVIEGGLKAWIKAGGAVEMVPASDIEHLPRFD